VIQDKITKIVNSTAEAFGCSAKTTFKTNCGPVYNPETQTNSIMNAVVGEFGAENINE